MKNIEEKSQQEWVKSQQQKWIKEEFDKNKKQDWNKNGDSMEVKLKEVTTNVIKLTLSIKDTIHLRDLLRNPLMNNRGVIVETNCLKTMREALLTKICNTLTSNI